MLELELIEEGRTAADWPVLHVLNRSRPRAAAWSRWVPALVPAVDLVAVVVASRLAGATPAMASVAAVTMGATMFLRRAYAARLRETLLDALPHVVWAATAGMTAAAAAAIYVEGTDPPDLGLLLRLFLAAALGALTARVAAVSLLRHARRRGGGAPTVIIGSGQVADRVGRWLDTDVASTLRPVAYLDHTDEARAVPVLERLALQEDVRHAVLAFARQPDESAAGVVKACERLGVQVYLVPRLFDVINHRVTYEPVGGLPLLGLRSTRSNGWAFVLKHAGDRLIAAVLLGVLAPLLIALAVAVRLSSPGPTFFRQRRVGRDGRVFELLKFRSMRQGPATLSDGAELVAGTAPGGVDGADRRTRVGTLLRRTSLDELPQLINVLRGEMSLVGPRPERPEFVERFQHELARYDERHRVRAGMTGWAQVHGLRGKTSLADRVVFDNHYIEHWSLWLDMRILLLTVIAVLRSAE